jgi:hypothetical protein
MRSTARVTPSFSRSLVPATPSRRPAVRAVLEAPSSKDVAGEPSRTAKVQSLVYLFFILAFGLVGLAWVIKILFF